MASKSKKAGGNHFALLETDDPGDTRLEQPQAAPASLTQELFGRAYPSAWEIMRNRHKQQYSVPTAANASKARAADSKKGAQGSSARKQGGRRHANGAAAVNDDGPAPRLYDLAEFPSLK